MAFQFFAPKTLGSVVIGLGALGGGGTIYWYQVPTTWRELLIKEGYVFLSTEQDYKGMFNDQKENENWSKESSLKDAVESDVKSKAEAYCKGKLDNKFSETSDSEYESEKQKLISFCTFDGIKTVKARIVQSKSTNLNWITEDDKWKAVFAVYRYDNQFIDWLKNDDENNNTLSAETNVDQFSKLKNACEKLLKKNHGEVENDHIKYGSWWCVELGYETIEDKIKRTDATWATRDANGDWTTLKTTWEKTDTVKKWANKANNKGEEEDLSEESLKKLCESSNVKSKLSDNDSYQEKYLVIMSVCKKEN